LFTPSKLAAMPSTTITAKFVARNKKIRFMSDLQQQRTKVHRSAKW
jgi:hypothetical protein